MASATPGPPRRRGRPPKNLSARGTPNGTPLKKRRYIPGGPGGGGRYVEDDAFTTPATTNMASRFSFITPRPRKGRPPKSAGHRRKTASARGHRTIARPRYSSAAAAAAAAVQGDASKPREERGWEEFHPQMDIEAKFTVYSSGELDPPAPEPDVKTSSEPSNETSTSETDTSLQKPATDTSTIAPVNGELVQPSESADSSENAKQTNAIGAPSTPLQEVPKEWTTSSFRVGTPRSRTDNAPRYDTGENLNLLKPSFRHVDTFATYERKDAGLQRYVDRAMANVGYQEGEMFIRSDRRLVRMTEGNMEEDLDVGPGIGADEPGAVLGGSAVGRVEYDMDEQDDKWLSMINTARKAAGVDPITRELFEITMTKIEKEWYALEKRIPKPNPKPPQTQRPRSSSAAAVNGEAPGPGNGEEQDSKCAICDDGDCENTNAIVFCDGCDLAVHQECYGVPFIPEGQWLCRKCQLLGQGKPVSLDYNVTSGVLMIIDLHILSKYRWCIQADEHLTLGSSAMRYLDSRSIAGKQYIHGARHGCR
jgi:NuA3 HAT complex component NTO1